jgi:diguanylate cyclase (GGDEF)-like protein
MARKTIHSIHWFTSAIFPCLIVVAGWLYIASVNHNLKVATLERYQAQELNRLRQLAQTIGDHLAESLATNNTSNTSISPGRDRGFWQSRQAELKRATVSIEQAIIGQLNEPHTFDNNNQFWIQPLCPEVDQSKRKPDDSRHCYPFHYVNPVGIEATQSISSKSNLQRAINQNSENNLIHSTRLTGTPRGLYWSSLFSQDFQQKVSVWTCLDPTAIAPPTPTSAWVIGTSIPLSAVLQEAGVYRQIQFSIDIGGLFSAGVLILWGVLLKLQANQRRYETEVERLNYTDNLTGVANRRRFHQSGTLALQNIQPAKPVALIAIDLDRFKPINGTLGAAAGDELLIKVTQRLQGCIRQSDLLARLDGDEFAILLENSSEQEAQVCAERLLKSLHQPFWVQHNAVHISGSIGVVTTKTPQMPFSQLLVQADIALDRSKNRLQGSYTVFNHAMHSETVERLQIEQDLRRSIEHNELQVYYQPIVNLSTNRISGYEALVRWQHRFKGLLQPMDFLPIAAEIGLSIAIERWVLNQACQQMVNWHSYSPGYSLNCFHGYSQEGPGLPSISVNLSAQHLAQPDLVEYVKHVLQETGWPAHRLTLEITEEAMIQHPEEVAVVLLHLQHLGVHISLDDFGTGYSSLSYLQRFPVDILKIDKSFIKSVNDRVQDGEIVRTIIALARSLGIGTIAEGIETSAQLQHLRGLNCQYGQGYLFSRPLENLSSDRLIYCHGKH